LKILIFIIGVAVFFPFAFTHAASERQATLKGQPALKVAILPVTIHSPENLAYIREGLVDMLSSRVEISGRVSVLEKGAVKKVFSQVAGEMDTESAKKLGRDLGADFVVFGSLTKLGDSASLDLKVVEVAGEKPSASVFVQAKRMEEIIANLDDLARKIDEKVLGYPLTPPAAEKPAERPKETAAVPAPLPGFQPMSPVRTERGQISDKLWQSQSFPFVIKGMAIGDLDGDGRNEIALIEDRKLWIYRYEKEFKLLKKIEGGKYDNYLAVDVGDIRKSGRAEIFVTNIQGDRLSSFVLAYRDGDFRIVCKDLEWFLRVVHWGAKGQVLLGQEKGRQAGWEGPIYELGWDGKGYKEIRRAEAPAGPSIYGFTPFSYEGKTVYAFIDSDSKLKAINPQGKVIWKSSDIYGSDNSFRVKPAPSGLSHYEGDEFAYVPVRIISRGEEIFVIRNISPIGDFFKRQKYFNKGEVQVLVWNGAMLMETWRSQPISGYLADFQIQDIDGDPGRELIVAVNLPKESILSREKNSVLLVSRGQKGP